MIVPGIISIFLRIKIFFNFQKMYNWNLIKFNVIILLRLVNWKIFFKFVFLKKVNTKLEILLIF